ncbi:MAG: family transcriptional regulator, nitrogen fixation regulation protein [Rhodospirillaceae bacterium]|jgi:CRP-like cAMP-binding protein|nr:family transcriptional regulator, nitrogen fixation regulation protein [Rhodospirillaceae bacterium]
MPLTQPSNRDKPMSVPLMCPRPERRDNLLPAMEALATTRRCRRGEEVYGRDDPVESWYRVVSGMARKSTLLSDGRRRIVDFLLPGDFFGFSVREERYFDVETVIEGTILVSYPQRRIEALADSDPEVGRRVRQLAFNSLSRLQARILILGRTTALEKVRAFLVEMSERSRDGTSVIVVLPMSRYDIADYLALSVETVSRALTALRRRGSITLADKHRLTIVARGALREGDGGGPD